ncbi:putative leader peptide [Klenkia taihuensis]
MPTSCLLPGNYPGDLLVGRIHVDLARVTTAACRAR